MSDALPGHSNRHIVSAPPWDDTDPYTTDAKLCDDDGIVRRGAMHHGTDYTCTGHAHFAGEHIRCISVAHPDGIPTELLDLLRAMPPSLCPPARSAAGQAARRRLDEIEGRGTVA